jgi:hypothetical protein
MNYDLIKKTVDRILENKYEWEFQGESAIKVDGKTLPLAKWIFYHQLEAMRLIALKDKLVNRICSYKSTVIYSATKDLFEILREELGTCEWILDEKIKSIYGVQKENKTVSFVIKTANDTLCSINVATTLSAQTPPIVKHEIVGEEGVITDRSINEQIPVESIYLFNNDKKHPETFTDIDFNMLGLSVSEVIVADTVIAALTDEEKREEMIKEDSRSRYLLKKAKESLDSETLITEVD